MKNVTPNSKAHIPAKKEEPKKENNLLASFQNTAGKGFENVDPTRDLSIPFLQIVQGLSPEKKKQDPKYIEGAEDGDVFNSVSRTLYKVGEPDGKPIIAIPCGFVRVWNEWKLRRLGGGFIKSHMTNIPETQKGQGKEIRSNVLVDQMDHELKETAMHSMLVFDENNSLTPVVISCTGAQLSPSKALLNRLFAKRICDADGKAFRPAMYVNRIAISTVIKKFTEGEAFVWKFDLVGEVQENEHFIEAQSFHTLSEDKLALMAPASEEVSEEKESDNQTPY